MYMRFSYYFLNFNLVKKNKRSFGEVFIKARSVMYAKQRRGRLAGRWGGGWVCRCVWWWWWGYDCSRIEEEALLLLYLQLYFVVAVAFLDHSFLVSSIAILSFILNFQLVLR